MRKSYPTMYAQYARDAAAKRPNKRPEDELWRRQKRCAELLRELDEEQLSRGRWSSSVYVRYFETRSYLSCLREVRAALEDLYNEVFYHFQDVSLTARAFGVNIARSGAERVLLPELDLAELEGVDDDGTETSEDAATTCP